METSQSESAMIGGGGRGSDPANASRSQSQAQLTSANLNRMANANGAPNANGEYAAARPSYATAARREYGLTSTSFNFDDYGEGVDIDGIRGERLTIQFGGVDASVNGELSPLEAPLSPLFPSSTVRASPTSAGGSRMSLMSSVGFAQNSAPAPTTEVPTAKPSARPQLLRSAQSMKGNLSYLNETPIEDYVAKYQVIKVSWRGKYERIFALSPTRFCTIDPKDFEVTNTWPLTSLLGVALEEGDHEGFTLTLKGAKKDEQLKLKCRFRSHLLSDLYRQQERNTSQGQKTPTQFPCAKWSRKGMNMDGLVEVGKDGLSFLRRDGSLRSTYLYVEMAHVSVVSGSSDGFAIGYGRRHRLFFSERRNHIVAQITSAAANLGLALPSRSGLTVASVQQERQQYGTDVGQAFVQFHVHKHTRKYPVPVERTLSLHQHHVVERDVDGGVVSCSSYEQIYVLVRSPQNQTDFDVQFLNGAAATHYSSTDRDGVLAAMYDLCVTCNANSELFITSAQNERGLRLLPSFATEDTAETHSFYGDTSIGICFLQRMTAVGKVGGSRRSTADRGFIAIVQEFNANVPASGILYDTKQSIIVEALRPIGAQLFFISKGTPMASRSAVALLQAMFRISSSYYGFREVAQIPHLAEALTNVLVNGDEFAVFWTTLVLKRLTVHSVPPSVKLDGPSLRSSDEVEAHNKSVLFGNTQLVQTLIAHLNGVNIKGSAPTAGTRQPIGPLVIMGLLQTLEGSLCSRKSTTAPPEFQLIVGEVAKFYGTLLKILFQSRCATTVEACTLLLKAILEECDPVVATQIRDAALAEGIVLRHLYQAIFDSSFDQRSVSRYLISLWMSHHPPSKQLLSRILPTGLMHLLDEPMPSVAELIEMDEIEREQLSNGRASDEMVRLSAQSDGQLNGNEGWPNLGELEASQGAPFARSASCGPATEAPSPARERRSMSSTFDTRGSLAVAAVSARESAVVRIENDYTKSRMLRKLQSSFLVSASRSVTNPNVEEGGRMSDASTTRDSSRGSKRDSGKSGSSSALEESQRVRKRDVAYDFISNAISNSKTQRPHPTKIKGQYRNGSAHGNKKDDREPENFRNLFHTLSHDHERVDLIWNASTRGDLKRSLLREMQQFGVYQNNKASGKAMWNYEDFRVDYPSLKKEPVVGGCYIRILGRLLSSTRGKPATSNPSALVLGVRSGAKEDTLIVFEPEDVGVRDPRRLIEHLYRRILRENIKAEHHNELDMTLACSQGLAIVATAYASLGDLTELDELKYLVQLMLDTVHAPVLEGLLRAVRALALARTNAKKLLEKDAIIDTLVRLLQLGHASDRSHSIAPPRAVWRLEEAIDEGNTMPVSVDDLHDMVASKKISVQSCRVVRCGDDVCEHAADGSPSQSLLENLQLRWEVGIQGKLATEQVACDAIQTLLLIAHSNALIENPTTRNSLFPVVRAKTSIRRRVRDILPLIARYNHPLLSERTAKLLNFVFDDSNLLQQRVSGNDDLMLRSSLHLWGLFYLIFLVDTLNFQDFAGLLKSTHLHQDGFDGISALTGIFPDALIDVLEKSGPQEFTQVFNGAVSSPDVIWSRDMRLHLRENCLAHVDDYLEILQEDVQSHWRFCPMAPVTYAELESEVWCGGVYLGKFCEREDFVISQPVEFMRKLTRTWRQEVDRKAAEFTYEEASTILGVEFRSTGRDIQPAYRAAFKARARELQNEDFGREAYAERIGTLREAYRIVTCPRDSLLTDGHDPVNLLLLLDAMIAMCNRYGAKLGEYYFDSYDLLLSLLESHSTQGGTPPPHTTEEQRMTIAARAAELLFRTCAVSARNADVLLKQAHELETLEKTIHFCVDHIVAEPEQHDPRIGSICCFVLQTITGLLASQAGRMWISDSTTLIVDMTRVLWFWNRGVGGTSHRVTLSKTVQQVLESISRMTLLKANQERILRTGAVWQLIVLFSRYDIALDEAVVRSRLGATISSDEQYETIADEMQNLLAIMAVRALCRLGGFFSPDSEFASPRNEDLAAALEALFTPNLARLLLLESHHEFLKIFHGECESYTLLWNLEMRQEMGEFVQPRAAIEPGLSTDENYLDAIKFRFDRLAVVFALGDVYIDALVSSLMILQQSEVPDSLNDLGLTERFFRELFTFIDNGKLPHPSFNVEPPVGEDPSVPEQESEVLAFRPHSGWHLEQAELESTFRVTALNCLALASDVLPYLVERYVSADAQVMKLLMRQLFPPDNEVHQSEEGETEALVFSEELYEPARYHCISILQALSSLNGFGRASYDIGICDILIELINLCREVGPQALRIIGNLCRTPARADFVTDILQTGPYIEFISWLVGVEPVESEEEKELAEALRLPAAELLAEMARSTGALSVESLAMLNRFFPASMTDQLVSEPQSFLTFYQSDHETPELVWNANAREFLRNNLLNLLNEYYTVASSTDDDVESVQLRDTMRLRLDTHVVDYSNIFPEANVGNVYLNLYLRDPTYRLRDPLLFVRCLWAEYETLYGDLSHLSSSLRDTRSPDDELMTETGEKFLDLVTASLVCALRTNVWLLDEMAAAKVPERCCVYLSECVRNNLSEACSVAVVRMLRVLSTSKKCVASIQPVSSNLLTSLVSQMGRSRNGVLYREAAFTLEIVRRVVNNFPSTITNGEGIVTVAMRIDLFNYLLNIVENPAVLGPVRQPNFVRAIAIDILNTLETDRIQARAAHDILKKNKKWEKKYRHEVSVIPTPAHIEDPFLTHHSPDLDRRVSEFAAKAPSTRPSNSNRSTTPFDATASVRGTMMDKFRHSPRHSDSQLESERASIASTTTGGASRMAKYRKMFSRG